MVIRAGEGREAAEERFASVAGVVCVEGPVPAVRPKDECSERRRRSHGLGRTLKAEYLGAHGSRAPNNLPQNGRSQAGERRDLAAGRKLKCGGSGGNTALAGQDGGAHSVLEQVGGWAGEKDFRGSRGRALLYGI